ALAEDPLEDDPERPVGERVAEQEQVRPAQPRGERDRQPARGVGVVDEVVLRHGEALPGPLGRGVDPALEMEHGGTSLEGELARVGVRALDRRRVAAGCDVAEAAAVPARGEVADGVELLAGLRERPLERELVAGRDEERLARLPLAQACRQRREEAVERRGLAVRLEQRVERVVERAGAVQRRDRLRHARQLGGLEPGPARELARERLGVRADDDRDATRQKRVGDLLEMVAGGHRSSPARRRLLAEDRRLEPLEERARLEPERVHERPAALPVDLERVRLPARAVEGEHQLASQPLAQRLRADERLELGNELGVAAERELRLGALLHERQPQLAQARDLRLRERLVRELRERLAAPDRERLAEEPRPARRIAGTGLVDEPADEGEVELPGLEAEDVSRRPPLDRIGAERLAELRDEVLQRRRRGRRRLARPERVDQPVGRDDPAGVEEEQSEQRPLLRSAERKRASPGDHLERAEDPELEHAQVVTAAQPEAMAAVSARLERDWRRLRRSVRERARTHPRRIARALGRRRGVRRRRGRADEQGGAGRVRAAQLRARGDGAPRPSGTRRRPRGPGLPRRRRPRGAAPGCAGDVHARSGRPVADARAAARELAERALLRARDDARPRLVVRAVRPPATPARRPPRARRPADEHLAGLQLRGRRLLVRGRRGHTRRPRAAIRRRRRPAALPRLRPGLPPLARGPRSRRRLPLRRRPRPGRQRRRARARLRPDRLSRTRGVRHGPRVRRRRALPRPRRQPRVPLGERLLLQGREAGRPDGRPLALARPRPPGGRARRIRLRRLESRPLPEPALRRHRRRAGAVALPRDRASRRHGLRRLRHRGGRPDGRLAARDARPRPDPRHLRPRRERRDDLLHDGRRREGLLGRRDELRRVGALASRLDAAREPLDGADASLTPLAWLAVALLLGAGGCVHLSHRHAPTVTGSTTTEYRPARPVARPPAEPGIAWPTFGFDRERVRAPAGFRLRPPFRRVWTFHGRALLEFPPVAGYGRVYIANFAGRLFSLDAATGRTLWSYASGRCGWASPALADHAVYETFIGNAECGSATRDGEVASFDADTGRLRWRRRTGPCESSPLVAGGTVYVGDWNGLVWALDARTGRTRWTARLDGAVKGSLALTGDRLSIGTYAGDVVSLDRRTGRVLWVSGGHGSIYSSPALAYGRVYVGSLDGGVYAFGSATGRLLWAHPTGGYVYASPAVWGREVLVGSYDHRFYAFDAGTGEVRWSFDAGAPISGAASVIDGLVYFSTFAERPFALDAGTGRVVATWPDGKYSPAIADGAHLYLVGLGRLYALVTR